MLHPMSVFIFNLHSFLYMNYHLGFVVFCIVYSHILIPIAIHTWHHLANYEFAKSKLGIGLFKLYIIFNLTTKTLLLNILNYNYKLAILILLHPSYLHVVVRPISFIFSSIRLFSFPCILFSANLLPSANL